MLSDRHKRAQKSSHPRQSSETGGSSHNFSDIELHSQLERVSVASSLMLKSTSGGNLQVD